jgi:Ca2+-binding RTX toxin-like protein
VTPGGSSVFGAADWIYGGDGNDYLAGEIGGDFLYGQADSDTLVGGDGPDTLYGGVGLVETAGGEFDLCIGNGGSDTAFTTPECEAWIL